MKATETEGWSRLGRLLSRLMAASDDGAAPLQGLFRMGSAEVRRLGEQRRAQYFVTLLSWKRDEAVEPQVTPTGAPRIMPQ